MWHNIEQGTEEWFALRQAKFTASTFKNLFATKTTASYNNEIYRVVFEKLTGESPETYKNEYMERGNELEPFARAAYEMESFNDVTPGGFFELNEFVGCSPDGLIGDEGGLEIKCPKFSTMIEYLVKKKLPTEYYWQVQGSLFVTKRKYWDFFGYHPKLKPLVVKVLPEEEAFEKLEKEIAEATKRVNEIIEKIR